jgi:hypothetical protein
MKVLKLILQFLFVFYSNQVHNMLAIMSDPQFKSLLVVKILVGLGNVIQLAFEDDLKPMIPLLMVCFEILNPTTKLAHILVMMTLKKKITCLGLENLLRSLFEHLSSENYLCS